MCDFIVAGAVKVFKKMDWLILPQKSTKQKQEQTHTVYLCIILEGSPISKYEYV